MTPGPAQEGDLDPVVLGQALLQAGATGPGSTVDALRALLRSTSLATDLTLYLVDYRLSALLPVAPRAGTLLRPEPVDGPGIGAAYRRQQTEAQAAPAGVLLHIPVTVRGQRLGVLTVTFPSPPPPHEQRAARSVALAAAYLLLEAGTGSDVYELGRRHARLALSAEMQCQLLPARAFRTPRFYVAGHLEPALRVAGDAFDFAVDDDALTLAVVNATASRAAGATRGSGSSSSSSSSTALLSTLAVTALRNARRTGLPLDEQAALASDMVHQHARGQQHASVLLLQLDARTGTAQAVDAGSGALVRLRSGTTTRQELDRQPPLGMLDDARYHSEPVDLATGDRAFVLDDTDVEDLARAMDVLEQTRNERPQPSPPEAVRRLVAALLPVERREDDTTVVCVDWVRP